MAFRPGATPVRFGFVVQGGMQGDFPQRSARICHARPIFVKVVDGHESNIAVLRQHAPKGTTFAIHRRFRAQQHLDDPEARADEHLRMILETWDPRFDATTGFNEIGIDDPDVNERYCRFQERLSRRLWEEHGIYYVFDCESAWHPGYPPNDVGAEPVWENRWRRKVEMYRRYQDLTGKRVLRCRHEYAGGGHTALYDVNRHLLEQPYIRSQGVEIDHVIGEWSFDSSGNEGHQSWWEQGITVEQVIARARRDDGLYAGENGAAGYCWYTVNGFGDWARFDIVGQNPGAERLWGGAWGQEPLMIYAWSDQEGEGDLFPPEREFYTIRGVGQEPTVSLRDLIFYTDVTASLPRHPVKTYDRVGINEKTEIIIHHYGGPVENPALASPEAVADYHVRGRARATGDPNDEWPGIGYTFIVDQSPVDGRIWKVNDLETVSFHAGSAAVNKRAVAICLQGNFQGRSPSNAQIQRTIALIEAIETFTGREWGRRPHFDVVTTECPGEAWNILQAATGGGPPPPPPPPPEPPLAEWAEDLRRIAGEMNEFAR